MCNSQRISGELTQFQTPTMVSANAKPKQTMFMATRKSNNSYSTRIQESEPSLSRWYPSFSGNLSSVRGTKERKESARLDLNLEDSQTDSDWLLS